jgi:hypothetical protein
MFDPSVSAASAADLRDWYSPAVGELSADFGRLICQRTNCFWDSRQRRRYRGLILSILAAVLLVLVSISLGSHLSLEEFVLTVLAPSFPFMMWAIRESREQKEAADRLDRLREHTADLWNRMMAGEMNATAAASESRRLQDAIYEHRRQSPLVFDWFYGLLRTKFEQQANATAEDMTREAHGIKVEE